MMRDPAEDKRTLMIRRLPEMMRILRTHFVTEKKPALPMQNIVQKLADSYKTTIRSGKFCILKVSASHSSLKNTNYNFILCLLNYLLCLCLFIIVDDLKYARSFKILIIIILTRLLSIAFFS